MIAALNLPLSVVEKDAFKNFCMQLQPFYVPPSRDTLVNKHIENLCDKYEEKVKEDLTIADHIRFLCTFADLTNNLSV